METPSKRWENVRGNKPAHMSKKEWVEAMMYYEKNKDMAPRTVECACGREQKRALLCFQCWKDIKENVL